MRRPNGVQKKSENPLIVTNIFGSDIPGNRLVRQRRIADKIPSVAILERKKRDGHFELHIVIRRLNRIDKREARDAIKRLKNRFQYVPETELYAMQFPQERFYKSNSSKITSLG